MPLNAVILSSAHISNIEREKILKHMLLNHDTMAQKAITLRTVLYILEML